MPVALPLAYSVPSRCLRRLAANAAPAATGGRCNRCGLSRCLLWTIPNNPKTPSIISSCTG